MTYNNEKNNNNLSEENLQEVKQTAEQLLQVAEPTLHASEHKQYTLHRTKLKGKDRGIDYSTYKYYNRRPIFRAAKFILRGASNVLMRAYLKVVHGVKVEGKHYADQLRNKGLVVVSNHIHPLDIQMANIFVFGMRPIHFLTLKKNLDLSVRHFIRGCGGVPIPEGYEDKKRCFKQMDSLLQDKGVLYLCPEGSLVDLCDDIRPFKDGAFRFAYQNKVPILPITFSFKQFNKHGKKYRYPKFTIHVLQAIHPDYPIETLKCKTREVMWRKFKADKTEN